jgi:FkbM family methyltransferase
MNTPHLLHTCLWETLLNHTGRVGRDQTVFLEQFYIDLCVRIGARLCIEIGAHEASGLRRLGQVLPEARLLAYEANPYVYQRFVNRVAAGIRYLNQAVAHDDQPRVLKIPRVMPVREGQRTLPRENLTSSLRVRNMERVEYEEVTVACTTLDSILSEQPGLAPVSLWIDVEGAAGDVLAGATRALRSEVALIYIELENKTSWKGQWLDQDVARFLAGYGFVPLARDMQTPWQYNQLFIQERWLESPGIMEAFRGLLHEVLARPADQTTTVPDSHEAGASASE